MSFFVLVKRGVVKKFCMMWGIRKNFAPLKNILCPPSPPPPPPSPGSIYNECSPIYCLVVFFSLARSQIILFTFFSLPFLLHCSQHFHCKSDCCVFRPQTRITTNCFSGVIPVGFSDHSAIFAVRKLQRLKPATPRVIDTRNFKRFNRDALIEDLNKVPLSLINSFADVKDSRDSFKQLFFVTGFYRPAKGF